jgi:hypothetical protein
MKICIALVLALTSTIAVAADRPTVTCQEVAEFAYGMTIARDRGQPQQRMESSIQEDSNFDRADKRILKDMVREIYRSPNLNPQAMGVIALESCKKSIANKSR